MTDVDTLRRAAAKIRELAEGATPGPWEEFGVMSKDGSEQWNSVGVERDLEIEIARLPHSPDGSCNTAHIAHADPPFMLAVADWLEATADHADATGGHCVCGDAALAVARAYLREP
jgi:hypothetical protein